MDKLTKYLKYLKYLVAVPFASPKVHLDPSMLESLMGFDTIKALCEESVDEPGDLSLLDKKDNTPDTLEHTDPDSGKNKSDKWSTTTIVTIVVLSIASMGAIALLVWYLWPGGGQGPNGGGYGPNGGPRPSGGPGPNSGIGPNGGGPSNGGVQWTRIDPRAIPIGTIGARVAKNLLPQLYVITNTGVAIQLAEILELIDEIRHVTERIRQMDLELTRIQEYTPVPERDIVMLQTIDTIRTDINNAMTHLSTLFDRGAQFTAEQHRQIVEFCTAWESLTFRNSMVRNMERIVHNSITGFFELSNRSGAIPTEAIELFMKILGSDPDAAHAFEAAICLRRHCEVTGRPNLARKIYDETLDDLLGRMNVKVRTEFLLKYFFINLKYPNPYRGAGNYEIEHEIRE